MRRAEIELIHDRAHYERVLAAGIASAVTSVWVATANLKDVHIEAPIGTRARARGRYRSAFELLEELGARGVDVRILHGGEPSRALRPRLARRKSPRVQLRQCPRVHFKMIAIDGRLLYLGSANFTGAGLGAKSDRRRNFETGIVTDDEHLLDAMQARFDGLWRGNGCAGCGLRAVCPSPIDALAAE